MAHITGTDRTQVLLLPDTVDDYVGPDNPVRFIDAFVDSLALAGAGFERAEPKETGRPPRSPLPSVRCRICRIGLRTRSTLHGDLAVVLRQEFGLLPLQRPGARRPSPGGLHNLQQSITSRVFKGLGVAK